MLTGALVASTSQGFWIHCPPWNLKQAHFSPCKTPFIQGKLNNTVKHFTQSRKIFGPISTDRGCKTLNSNQLCRWLSDLSTRYTHSFRRVTPISFQFSSWIHKNELQIPWLISIVSRPLAIISWWQNYLNMANSHQTADIVEI